MYDRGAGTGLFDDKDATVHFSYARAFAATYPAVPIHPEHVLVISVCPKRW
jgi:transcriptional regulator GlxA family with amidase domain